MDRMKRWSRAALVGCALALAACPMDGSIDVFIEAGVARQQPNSVDAGVIVTLQTRGGSLLEIATTFGTHYLPGQTTPSVTTCIPAPGLPASTDVVVVPNDGEVFLLLRLIAGDVIASPIAGACPESGRVVETRVVPIGAIQPSVGPDLDAGEMVDTGTSSVDAGVIEPADSGA